MLPLRDDGAPQERGAGRLRKRSTGALREEEQAGLRTLVGRGTETARMLTHARIGAQGEPRGGGPGWTDGVIGAALEVSQATVERVRQTYATAGLEAALAHKTPERVDERKRDGAGWIIEDWV